MRRLVTRVTARLTAAVGLDASSVRQALVALLIAAAGGFLAGLTLGSLQRRLEALPGLLVLIPAAIGMRGNVFGSLGSRLGTTIHTGTFTTARRRDTVVAQNMAAALVLSLSTSVGLGFLAKTVAVAFGIHRSISLLDFVVISVASTALSSVVVLAITVGIAAAAVRNEWDPDNVAAPLVTATGDVVTLPAIWVASYLAGIRVLTSLLGVVFIAVSVMVTARAIRSRLLVLRKIVRESVAVLVIAGTFDVIAGLAMERRLAHFLALPALLVLVPPFLEEAGALGGILASRLGTKLHLGVIRPSAFPGRSARPDLAIVVVLAVPMWLVVGTVAHGASRVAGIHSPGLGAMVLVTLIAGAMMLVATLLVGWYGAVASYRVGLDPDNHGIPLVTSLVDLLGALALVLAIVLVGLAPVR